MRAWCASDQLSEKSWYPTCRKLSHFKILCQNGMHSFLWNANFTGYISFCNSSVSHYNIMDFIDHFWRCNSDRPSSRLCLPRLNSATHLFTVAYEGASFPSVAIISLLISLINNLYMLRYMGQWPTYLNKNIVLYCIVLYCIVFRC